MGRKERRLEAKRSRARTGTAAHEAQALLETALREQRAGRLAAAEGAYLELIRRMPASAGEAHHRLGVLYAQTGRSEQAIRHIGAAAELDAGNAAALNDLGTAYAAANRLDDAVAAYRKAIARNPAFAQATFNLANLLFRQHRIEEAVECYRRAAALAPRVVDVHVNLGVALHRAGQYPEAVAAFRRALELEPRSFNAQYNLGITLAAAQRYDEAAAAYRAALAIDAGVPWAHVNLGYVLHRLRRHDEAVACYERALALAPGLAQAHNNLGLVYREQDRLDEAIACFRRAIAAAPDSAEAQSNLGNALIARSDRGGGKAEREEAKGALRRAIELRPDFIEAHFNLAAAYEDRIEEAFEYYMRYAELRYGRRGIQVRHEDHPAKAKHDREQLEYLIAEGIALERAQRLSEELAAGTAPPDLFEGFFHIEGGGRLPGPAIDPANRAEEIEAKWLASAPNVVVVDGLLTPEAHRALLRFCWGSTIWRREYPYGYVGALPEHGFACPLVAQIAEELRLRFPRIFASHRLTQTWAVKCDSSYPGINIHADFAAVNVNFWITPDEANLDPDSGGLVVWDKPAPLDWDFNTYNSDEKAMRDFIARSGAKAMTVPYRANRALVFDSDLIHETDRIAFKQGYKNRRINITMLYGFRDK